jgi:serine/threonine-protein kinase
VTPALPPHDEANRAGTVLSQRYALKRVLGTGSMGAVYAAEPVGGGAPVAVKVLHSHFIGDEQVMTRFLEEGRTCMRLVHPNIIRVHECLAAEDGSPYLVMDLLEGIPLSAYTVDGGHIALDRAIPIIQGVLAGLEAAHAAGVVHRDLKPANVVLARAGGVFDVKVLDFGIAKVMDAAGRMGTKTKTGALLGTPAYMSPEQVRNAKDVDARSDLWSVGVMLYEMLVGRPAFPAPTEYARLAAVLSDTPTPIQSIAPELAAIAPFLERAMEKDRTRRFQSAREMAVALAAPTPTQLDAPRPATPSAPPPARHSWPVRIDIPVPLVPVGMPPAPADVLVPQPSPPAPPVRDGSGGGTLASPHGVVVPVAAPTEGPGPVVILSDAELAAARAREAARRAEEARSRRSVAIPVVIAIAAVMFTAGFALGWLLGHGL